MSGSGRVSIYIYIHVGLVEGFEEERGTKRLRGSREVNGERAVEEGEGGKEKRRGMGGRGMWG